MFDDLEPKTKKASDIQLGCELSTFSLEDIDERVALLEAEIVRLKDERARKAGHLDAAQSFFKS
ncbi:DUF1192 domain-containing protein [Ahrensia sp. R2A130]|uniref:DUF1192 domain-containing protein n=1 Tax=Ahrensia sp. R2A130 TaxID=744979 RepID=UPI0001E0ACA5|nr:DUF1192 domain-containing protein [Ahrensia sp. R2A130]EFL88660.1 conserved domain protein [Ahrensia sp. R2A130]